MLTLNNNKALKLCLPCLFPLVHISALNRVKGAHLSPLSVQCIGHNSEMCLLKQLCASSHGSRGRKIKGPEGPEPGEGATFQKNFFSDICLLG